MSTRQRKTTYVRRRRRPAAKRYATNVVTGSGRYRQKASIPRSMSRPAPPSTAPSSSLSPGWGSALGAIAGNAIVPGVGGLVGSLLGHGAQALMKHITGFGDYNLNVNSLMGPAYSPPELINKSQRGVCLRHREYIADITASSAFTLQSFAINPGLSETFPWLAGVAQNFEEYAITGMIFEYKTLSADYTTASSAALGYVVMATEYNVLKSNFTDKQHMENYEFANSGKPSESFIHPIECKKSLNPISELFVRTGPVEADADARLYDLGNFQIATGGNSGSGIIGELWCTFEVCFYKSKLLTEPDEVLSSHWKLNSVTNASPFGSAAATLVSGSTIPATITGGSLTFPDTIDEGLYQIIWAVKGSSTTVIPPTWTATSGCTILSRWFNDTVTIQQTPSSVASTTVMAAFYINITAASAEIVCNDDGTLPTSATAGDLWILQVNPDIGG